MPQHRVNGLGRGRCLKGGNDMGQNTCSVEGCERPVLARELCSPHYERWRAKGDVLAHIPLRPRNQTLEEIFLRFTQFGPHYECHPWTGPLNWYKYGDLGKKHPPRIAHRYAYARVHGPIPDGLTIDHLCHNADPDCPGGRMCLHRRCQNIFHLEAVPLEENIRRAGLTSFAAVNLLKTHCPQAHPYDEENTKWYEGRRYCRACHNEDGRRRRAAQ